MTPLRETAPQPSKNLFLDEKKIILPSTKNASSTKKDLRSSKKIAGREKDKAKLRLHFFSPGQEKKRFPTKNIAEETRLTK